MNAEELKKLKNFADKYQSKRQQFKKETRPNDGKPKIHRL